MEQMLQALMGNLGAQQNQAAPVSPHLIEFKAGKLNMRGTTVCFTSSSNKYNSIFFSNFNFLSGHCRFSKGQDRLDSGC
jgi:hypothetical protein